MILSTALLFSLFVSSANSACDNDCSGHGECDCGFCVCHDNWGVGQAHDTGDCSDRVCPYELSWVDAPDENGRRHKYLECSGQGICDRFTGECECFDGYEGKSCQRNFCPNDCSGHGKCKFLGELSIGAMEYDYGHLVHSKTGAPFEYQSWDLWKERGCHCDAEWIGADCSQRMCHFGSDTMDRLDNQFLDKRIHTQRLKITEAGDIENVGGKTFSLKFRSRLNESYTTIPIVFTPSAPGQMARDIESALLSLPRFVIDNLQVHADDNYVVGNDTPDTFVANITFVGEMNQGFQNIIEFESFNCGEGCTPMLREMILVDMTANITEIVQGDLNSYECGRRGKCDYETGLCECFEGFTGPICGTCTNLI